MHPAESEQQTLNIDSLVKKQFFVDMCAENCLIEVQNKSVATCCSLWQVGHCEYYQIVCKSQNVDALPLEAHKPTRKKKKILTMHVVDHLGHAVLHDEYSSRTQSNTLAVYQVVRRT